MRPVSVNEPTVGESEIRYVEECLRTGWISSAGRFLTAFEEAWASYCGRAQGVAVSSGTAALDIAMACCRLKPGDEVIVPSFTIISCVQAILRAGGKPVLVDSDPDTWCMDVDDVRRKLTPKTRAIMAVHIYGHPVDMDPLLALVQERQLLLIEDAAQAHGAQYKGRRCGSFGHISCFSFYANKIVTTGEGGMVLADDPLIVDHARRLRNLCFQPARRFIHEELGFNYRMTNLQAAIGLAQVERVAATVDHKREIGRTYAAELADVDGLQHPVEKEWATNVYWMYGVVLRDDVPLDAVEMAGRLAQRGVETRPFFTGMHDQPVFSRMGLFRGQRYPICERLSRRGLYLPSGTALTLDDVARVSEAVRSVLV